ncbi:MAG: hypothetical protein QNJ35_11585 [Paracoccaceae bacterium]|nr:hypothetical protein [Paracoccaceae bacterium]
MGLSACGGGGAGNLGFVDLSNGPVPYASLDTAADRLISYGASDPTDIAGTMPAAGIVGYYGVIIIGEDLEPAGGISPTGYVGRVDLEADFAAGGDLTGTADSFFETDLAADQKPAGTGVTAVASSGWAFTHDGDGSDVITLDLVGTVDGIELSGTLEGNYRLDGATGLAVRTLLAAPLDDALSATDYDAALAADTYDP